jgi:hypothetical protein
MINVIGIVWGVLVLLVAVGWIGLQIKPKSFPAYPERTPELETVPLPDDLPEPVARYFQTTVGDQIPVIQSAVITGTASMRVNGITFPCRFRFTHVAGQDYRHYIEATVYGFPVMKVNEWYLDGHSTLKLPFGTVENEPQIDQAANLGLWAESIWLPSIFLTDPRVRWTVVDRVTAQLIVPFGEEEDSFLATFDPETGLLLRLEAMRWKNAGDEEKVLWINEVREWETVNGLLLPTVGAATWEEEGTPWAVFTVEDVVYNVDVSEYVRDSGL